MVIVRTGLVPVGRLEFHPKASLRGPPVSPQKDGSKSLRKSFMYWGGPQVDTQVPPLCSSDKTTMHVVHTETRLIRTLGPQNCREDLQLGALPAYSPSRGCQGLNPKYPYQLFTNTFSVSIRALGLCSQMSWWLASVVPSAGQFVSTLCSLGLTLSLEFWWALPFCCSCHAAAYSVALVQPGLRPEGPWG